MFTLWEIQTCKDADIISPVNSRARSKGKGGSTDFRKRTLHHDAGNGESVALLINYHMHKLELHEEKHGEMQETRIAAEERKQETKVSERQDSVTGGREARRRGESFGWHILHVEKRHRIASWVSLVLLVLESRSLFSQSLRSQFFFHRPGCVCTYMHAAMQCSAVQCTYTVQRRAVQFFSRVIEKTK